jgi:hypothetical protein
VLPVPLESASSVADGMGPNPAVSSQPLRVDAHTDGLDCWVNTSPPTPAEQYFVNTTGPHFPNVTSAQLVQYARQSCYMLSNGTTSGYVVTDLAQHMGIDKDNADQVMDGAMEADCPNVVVR